ncbi:hypothetical protein GCM10007962_29020 [Yeosuana aromativorans]|uniref:Outer membrane protein beta-barrel domain-containing protein n=1 Tax=Yeosuana aromativorans TaxID=288019 RepID=A0A8J3FIB9_9FLAO|nr:outer membrane beta-barrel protein [Yeosuana aromativorans]GGK32924.1 hypothetical protein GCM10007962_29020 [Yeosuana aromativorans]
MKILKLFFFIALLYTTANAQITKGNWLVGGDANFSSVKNKSETGDEKFNDFRINPNVGYFFMDKISGGLQVNLVFTNTNPGNDSTKASSYGFAPFVRYYFLETDERINIFAEANYSYRIGKTGSSDNINWNGYGFKAGTVLFFNSSVGLEFSINYVDTTRRIDNFNINTIFVGFGFQIHLEKK